MEQLNVKLLEKITCENCVNLMIGEIYTCANDHTICNLCWISYCPLCEILTVNANRNYTLESISRMVYYPCINKDLGCIKMFKINELEEHTQVCSFREYVCKLDKSCYWQGRKNYIKSHSIDEHNDHVLVGPECTCIWKETIKMDYEVDLMLAYNRQFYVHRQLKNDTMYWAVQYIGNAEDIILYCFHVHIFTDQFDNRKLICSEICHDDAKEIDEMTGTGFCVAIPMAVLDTYRDTDDVIFYKITIDQV